MKWGCIVKYLHVDYAAEEVREGEMPPWSYLPTHPEANFSGVEKREFIKGLVAAFGERDDWDEQA